MHTVCFIGSGPSALFAAQRIVQKSSCMVHILEKEIVPFGLARYGIAPDHKDKEKFLHTFDSILRHERIKWIGNLPNLNPKSLLEKFDSVVLATGALNDRKLGIKGEDLPNVIPSSHFVKWYNGYPNIAPNFSLDSKNVVIVGHGNVALDCARLLLKNPKDLQHTEIPESVLEYLKSSKVQNIRIIGRRGPLQMSFSPQELRELVEYQSCLVDKSFLGDVLDYNKEYLASLSNRKYKRMLTILQSCSPPTEGRQWSIDYLKSPINILGDSKCEQMTIRLNKLAKEDNPFNAKVIPTESIEHIPADLVIECLGYTSDSTGMHCDSQGTVYEDGKPIDGLFGTGWFKTGASGNISTSRIDAINVADNVLKYLETSKKSLTSFELPKNTVSYEEWLKLDNYEIAKGKLHGKPREKIEDKKLMFDIMKK